MKTLPPAGEAIWAKVYGFDATPVQDADAWCVEQVAQGRIVVQWNKECTIWCDPARVGDRLAHWVAQGVTLAPRMVLETKQSFWDALEFFSEGDLDAFVTPTWRAEFTPAMREQMRTMGALMEALPTEATTEPADVPDLYATLSGNAYLLNFYGKLLAYARQPSEAGKAFRMCIEVMPEFSEPYSNLGTLLWRYGKRREAFVMMTEALNRCPYRLVSQMNFIEAGYELEEYAEMTTVLEALIPHLPNLPELRHHAAICCQKLGKTAQALGMLDALLAQYPNDAEAATIRSNVQEANPG